MRKEDLANGVGRDEGGEHELRDQLCTRICDEAHRRRYIVNFLVLMFGIGACIGVNGIAAESPLLVLSAPESSALPSNLAIAAVTAYVGPAIYALFNRSTSRIESRNMVTWISTILVLGTVAMGLLAFFHDVTTTIFAADRSTVLLILAFISASIAGLRNVLLMPYLKIVEDVNLTSFFIGEGLSGFIPSIVALFQGVGGDLICPNITTNSTDPPEPYIPPPNFPPRDYFLFLAALLAASTGSFWILEYLRVHSFSRNVDEKFRHDRITAEERSFSKKLLGHESAEKPLDIEMMNTAVLENSMKNSDRIYLCTLMFLISFIGTGYLATIETFSSRPYGNTAHHLALNLSQLAVTSACVLAYWLPPIGIRGVTYITGLVTIAVSFVTWLALSSPTPLWKDTSHGVILLVTVWVLLMGLISYAKLAITAIIWKETSDAGLYQLGFVMLFGAFCGCVIAFSLVSFTTLFKPFAPCALH